MYVTKGAEMPGHDITINFHAIPTGALGPWTVYYYPGEMVWTHLAGKDGDYTTTWWNGKGRIVSKAVITELPTPPGETVEVPRRNANPIPTPAICRPHRARPWWPRPSASNRPRSNRQARRANR